MELRHNDSVQYRGGSNATTGAANVVETIQLIDKDGNVLATFQKAVDGTFSLDIQGSVAATSGLFEATPMAFIADPTDAAETQQAVIDIIAGLITNGLMEAS